MPPRARLFVIPAVMVAIRLLGSDGFRLTPLGRSP